MTRLTVTIVLLAIMAIGFPAPAGAQVFTPWVVSKGEPDTRDLERVAQALYRKAGAVTDRQKAETLWCYLLTDGRFVEPGMFYHIAGWAYEEPLGEVLDPVKLLNSYGFGLCYQDGPLLEALFEAGGFRDARSWFLTGHTVCEVYFDGRYNMLDCDMLGYTTLGGGNPRTSPIASVSDLEADGNLILSKLLAPDRADTGKVVYPWYPADVRARAMDGYAGLFTSARDNRLYPFHRYPQGASMEYRLRPGEKLIRFYQPENDRLYYLPYKRVNGRWEEFPHEIEQYRIRTEDGPHSQKDSRRWATGRQEYRPPLERRSAYYPVFTAEFNDNLALPGTAGGAVGRADSSRPAAAVFEMSCPYVLIDAEMALYAELGSAACQLVVETSTDCGASWEAAGGLRGPYAGPWRTGPKVCAASAHGSRTAVSGRYGYLVRITLIGPEGAGQAQFRDLALISLFQLNPRSLPRLAEQENELVYSPGEPEIRRVIPVDISRLEKFTYRAERIEYVEEADNRLVRPVGWQKGEIVFEVSSPDGADLRKFSAGGHFLALDGLAPEKTTAETRPTPRRSSLDKVNASLEWSVSAEGPFETLWRFSPPKDWLDGRRESRLLAWPEVDRTVENLPAGTRKVYVRYSLDGMALDDVRLAVTAAAEPSQAKLLITHRWLSQGQTLSQTVPIDNPRQETVYTVNTGMGEVIPLAVEFECPPE